MTKLLMTGGLLLSNLDEGEQIHFYSLLKLVFIYEVDAYVLYLCCVYCWKFFRIAHNKW